MSWPRLACSFAIGLAALLATPPLAGAVLTFPPGSTTLQVFNKAGEPDTRAGGHPYRLLQGFTLKDADEPPEYLRDLNIDFPPGLSGDPDAVPLCPRAAINTFLGDCPRASQVGLMLTEGESQPLYSIQPLPNEPASFAVGGNVVPLVFHGRLRPDDQGLSLYLTEVPHSEGLTLTEAQIELWGVPADHQQGTGLPRKPLLTLPTRCDGSPLSVTTRLRTWETPDRWETQSGDSGHPLVGCGSLPFDSSAAISLGNPRADAPSGAEIDLTVPQSDDPDGFATSQVKTVEILLPEGMTISPGGAGGLGSCSDAQLGLGTDKAPSCPAASRAGTVELDIGALSKPLTGSIYLGQERPGQRFRLFAVASGSGAQVKFVATLRADPRTGRLTTTLDDLPQASFDRLSLRFDGGPNALLATPLSCGRAPASATIVPYSGAKVAAWTGAVSIAGAGGAPCAGQPPFGPTFLGGSSDAVAGRATAFTTTVRRSDGEQLPDRLSVAFPPGVSAALGKVIPCPALVIPSGACPAASRLGSAVAELGPGSSPARIAGGIFFSGPYKRAPYGLVMVFRAAIGPFDLGTLVVRGALRVNPLSGQVTAAMDSLPTILEGIPIRFQTIGLDLDRPGFMHNPTSCAPASVGASLRSASGASATPTSPFTVRGCIDLRFRPRFSIGLNGGDELREEGRPGLRISARVPAGDANMRMAEISFPRLLELDSTGLREICARGQAMAGHCPKGSRVGSGYARTPLLSKPMTGSIYVVQPRDNGSPDLWTSLGGEGLRVSLRAETAVEHGVAATRLVHVPDFPLASFTMRLDSGRHGIFKLKRDPCAGRAGLVAPMDIAAQNGARKSLRTKVAVAGGCGDDG